MKSRNKPKSRFTSPGARRILQVAYHGTVKDLRLPMLGRRESGQNKSEPRKCKTKES